jgi:hypothetical protein
MERFRGTIPKAELANCCMSNDWRVLAMALTA